MYFTYWRSDNNNNWYWNLKAANHQIVAHGEGYPKKSNCEHAIDLVKSTTGVTPVKDLS